MILLMQKISRAMKIKVIKTEKDYNKALKRLEEVFDATITSPQGDEAELLIILNKKRKLSLNMIRKLHKKMRIPYDSLLT